MNRFQDNINLTKCLSAVCARRQNSLFTFAGCLQSTFGIILYYCVIFFLQSVYFTLNSCIKVLSPIIIFYMNFENKLLKVEHPSHAMGLLIGFEWGPSMLRAIFSYLYRRDFRRFIISQSANCVGFETVQDWCLKIGIFSFWRIAIDKLYFASQLNYILIGDEDRLEIDSP